MSCPSTFLALQVQLVVFGERFCDGQYSLASFFFAVLLLTVPRAQPFLKVGARAPMPYLVGATVCMYARMLLFRITDITNLIMAK